MALRDIFKFSRKTFFNPMGWIDFQGLRSQNIIIWNSIRDVFSVPKAFHEETFESAMKRLNLTEEDVAAGSIRYRSLALLFVLIATFVFAYSFYLLFRYGTFLGWLLGLSVCALFLTQAFRFDFWSFQMKSRKLGVTFEEWKNSILGDKGSST